MNFSHPAVLPYLLAGVGICAGINVGVAISVKRRRLSLEKAVVAQTERLAALESLADKLSELATQAA